MDQLFGGDEPKQPRKPRHHKQGQRKDQPQKDENGQQKEGSEGVQKEGNQGAQKKEENGNVVKRERKDRGRKKDDKNKPNKVEQVRRNLWEELELPLVIKLHRSIVGCDGQQMKLDEFIQFMYPEESSMERLNKSKIIRSFEKEDDEGNIEYKLKLVKPTDDRLDHLTTQMKFRIGEGLGECYYRIGVEDDGKAIGLDKFEMYESLKTICTIANKVHADVTAVSLVEGIKGNIAELMITKNQKQGVKLEIRLLLMGEPGSGKSTLLGMIKSGEKDNGQGYARTKVFQHKDEFMSGITQSKSHHVIAFDSKGKLFNHKSMMSIENWLENSSKLLSFIDVGGHKEKQVVESLCSFFPEYALWVVSGENKNISTNTIELARLFNLPLIVVITHLDRLDKEKEMEAVLRIKKVLKEQYLNKTPHVVREMEKAVLFSRITSTEDVIPIFLISSLTGENIELLINFFNLLTSISELRQNEDLHSEFLISYKYNLDKSIVLAGTVIKGTIKKGQILHLGPDAKGAFRAVEVDSIECMRVPVKIAKCGQICTIAIKLLSYAKDWLEKQPNAIRKGMVLIESKSNPKATHEFSAEFYIYGNNPQENKITGKYQPVINTLTTRQICDIVVMPSGEELEIPRMSKKKSKSIDIFHSKSHSIKSAKVSSHNLSHSALKTNNKEGIKEQRFKYGIKKQSEDLTDALYLNDSQEKKESRAMLATISEAKEEVKGKKKKDRDTEIKFSDKEKTVLRLRFKYYPEFLEKGQKLVISELKLIGKVTELHY